MVPGVRVPDQRVVLAKLVTEAPKGLLGEDSEAVEASINLGDPTRSCKGGQVLFFQEPLKVAGVVVYTLALVGLEDIHAGDHEHQHDQRDLVKA